MKTLQMQFTDLICTIAAVLPEMRYDLVAKEALFEGAKDAIRDSSLNEDSKYALSLGLGKAYLKDPTPLPSLLNEFPMPDYGVTMMVTPEGLIDKS